MWACVIVVFSVVGFSWFRSTSKQLVALVNPEQAQQDQMAEAKQGNTSSPFATISQSWKNLTANIGELFNFTQKSNDIQITNQKLPEIEPNLLPLSADKK